MIEVAARTAITKAEDANLESHHDKLSVPLEHDQLMNAPFGRNYEVPACQDTGQDERRKDIEQIRYRCKGGIWDPVMNREISCETTEGSTTEGSSRSTAFEGSPDQVYELYDRIERFDSYENLHEAAKVHLSRNYDKDFVERKRMQQRKPFVRLPTHVNTPRERNNRHKFATINPSIFQELHDCSKPKNSEGRKRREEIRNMSEERARKRNGAYRTHTMISAERGSRLYYVGMMHKVQMERRVAERALELDIQFETRMNLQQMVGYYFKMQQGGI